MLNTETEVERTSPASLIEGNEEWINFKTDVSYRGIEVVP
jgi:hypothetical protein